MSIDWVMDTEHSWLHRITRLLYSPSYFTDVCPNLAYVYLARKRKREEGERRGREGRRGEYRRQYKPDRTAFHRELWMVILSIRFSTLRHTGCISYQFADSHFQSRTESTDVSCLYFPINWNEVKRAVVQESLVSLLSAISVSRQRPLVVTGINIHPDSLRFTVIFYKFIEILCSFGTDFFLS